jgi:hypothetical protein
MLDVTTRKIKRICFTDFQRAAETGVCSPVTYALISVQALFSTADTQSLEGDMRLISVMAEKSPNVGLSTLSHRNAIKKKIGVGGNGDPDNHSNTVEAKHIIRVRGERLVNHLHAYHHAPTYQTIASDTQRWDPAPPRPNVILGKQLGDKMKQCFPSASLSPENIWAAPYCLQLHRHFKFASAGECWSVGPISVETTVYLVSGKHRYSSFCTVCRVEKERDSEAPGFYFQIAKPRRTYSARHIISELFQFLEPPESRPLYIVPLVWDLRDTRRGRIINIDKCVELATLTRVPRPGKPHKKKKLDLDSGDGDGDLGNDLELVVEMDDMHPEDAARLAQILHGDEAAPHEQEESGA